MDYPRIVTPPPGPKAREILARDESWASTSYIKEYPLVVERGRGAMIEDVDGNRYLDFMAGIATASTGHAHPVVVKAVQDAAEKLKLPIPGTALAQQLFRAVEAVPGGGELGTQAMVRAFEQLAGRGALDRNPLRQAGGAG